VDIFKQIRYWSNGAEEELGTAEDLMEKKRWRQALFFAHLALEKILKAHVCNNLNDFAPRKHNLVELAKQTNLDFPPHFTNLFAEMNIFNQIGRYPEENLVMPSLESIHDYFQKSREACIWLKKKLPQL
jgi:HEPN domain-containing protein